MGVVDRLHPKGWKCRVSRYWVLIPGASSSRERFSILGSISMGFPFQNNLHFFFGFHRMRKPSCLSLSLRCCKTIKFRSYFLVQGIVLYLYMPVFKLEQSSGGMAKSSESVHWPGSGVWHVFDIFADNGPMLGTKTDNGYVWKSYQEVWHKLQKHLMKSWMGLKQVEIIT